MNIQELVRRTRQATRLSQVNFGRLLGVNHRYISKWERGETIPSTTAQRLLQLILADPGGMVERLANLDAAAMQDAVAEQPVTVEQPA